MMTTWMIVEDDPDLYEVLSELIGAIGHAVLGFTSGEDALQWVEQVEAHDDQGELPELMLMDIRLPGQLTGVDVAARLRSSEKLGKSVLVLMTAYRLSPPEELAIAQTARPDMLLYKPLPSFPEFRRRLEDLLM